MHYTVYKISNQINGKVYIGCHKTLDLNDGYMGSGKYLNHAIKKHGIENFTKEILHDFGTPEEMFAKEKELVSEEFLAETNTYNLKIGGFGGWDRVNKTLTKEQIQHRARRGFLASNINNPLFQSMGGKRSHELKRGIHDPNHINGFLGKKHTSDTKKKIGAKNSKHQIGEKNSNFGKMWIYSLELKSNRSIEKTETIPDGWHKGRKFLWK